MSKWINYWSKKSIWQKSDLWRKNSELFYKRSKKYINFNNKILLDLGCGDGALIDILKEKTKKICGADISDEFVSIVKNKNKFNKKIIIKKFNKKYTNLKKFKNKFDVTICNSVTQYFKSYKEIINLIREVKKVSKKNSLFLISDIHPISPKKKIPYIVYSILDGYFFNILKLFLNNYFSKNYKSYRFLETNTGLLKINLKKFEYQLSKNNLKFKIINERLTTNYNSFHILLKF